MVELTDKDVITLIMYRPNDCDRWGDMSTDSDMEIHYFTDIKEAKEWATQFLAVAYVKRNSNANLSAYEITMLVNGICADDSPEEVGGLIYDFVNEVTINAYSVGDFMIEESKRLKRQAEATQKKKEKARLEKQERTHYEKLKAKYGDGSNGQ